MARYKPYDLNQTKMIPLSYADQVVEGSFEHALNEIVEEHPDLTVFDKRYANDATGRPAYDPRILLKVVLYYDLPRGEWGRRPRDHELVEAPIKQQPEHWDGKYDARPLRSSPSGGGGSM